MHSQAQLQSHDLLAILQSEEGGFLLMVTVYALRFDSGQIYVA